MTFGTVTVPYVEAMSKGQRWSVQVVNRHGQPLLKAWTIATDMPELSVLEDFKCTHEHQHAQSRGKDLKNAENYTYELTDLIHRCFELSAHGDVCAMALLLAADDHESAEQNAELWDAEMRSLFLAETWKDFGNTQTSKLRHRASRALQTHAARKGVPVREHFGLGLGTLHDHGPQEQPEEAHDGENPQ